jgi:hypothetical protein
MGASGYNCDYYRRVEKMQEGGNDIYDSESKDGKFVRKRPVKWNTTTWDDLITADPTDRTKMETLGTADTEENKQFAKKFAENTVFLMSSTSPTTNFTDETAKQAFGGSCVKQAGGKYDFFDRPVNYNVHGGRTSTLFDYYCENESEHDPYGETMCNSEDKGQLWYF